PRYLKAADAIAEWAPALHRATFFNVRGRGAELAKVPHLAGLREITFADWMLKEDAEALAASPYLTRLATLQLWVCALPPSRAVCLTFANSPPLTGLREVRLHQLYGGLLAEREAHATNIFADAQASKFKQARGESFQAVVERPFQRLFPLDGDLGYG